MISFNPVWDDWTATSIDGPLDWPSNTFVTTDETIDNSGKLATEISVTVTYSGVVSTGIGVYILSDTDNVDIDGGTLPNTDNEMFILMPYESDATKYRVFTVPAYCVAKFKVMVGISSDVDVSVRYHQCTAQSS